MSRYAKAIAAAVMAGLETAATIWTGNPWITIGIAAGGVLMVYLVPNQP